MPSWYWSPPADARRNQPNGRSQRSSRGQGGDHDDFHASHPPKLTRFGPGLGAFMAGVTDGGGPRALRVTCARDGREHLVSDTEMDAGHAGPRVALCGTTCCPRYWSARLVHRVRAASRCAGSTPMPVRQQVGGVGTAGRECWPGCEARHARSSPPSVPDRRAAAEAADGVSRFSHVVPGSGLTVTR